VDEYISGAFEYISSEWGVSLHLAQTRVYEYMSVSKAELTFTCRVKKKGSQSARAHAHHPLPKYPEIVIEWFRVRPTIPCARAFGLERPRPPPLAAAWARYAGGAHVRRASTGATRTNSVARGRVRTCGAAGHRASHRWPRGTLQRPSGDAAVGGLKRRRQRGTGDVPDVLHVVRGEGAPA
jgi:hypothetical protein